MANRNLLESGISVDLINREAKMEKLSIPPINRMHYYFTRKPLISSRLVLAGALLGADDVKNNRELNNLFGLDPTLKKRAYKNVPISLLKKIKERHPEGVTILDPFAGSGMILFEALRLGLNVVALDYNPVAYLIMKGTLEYPSKYRIIKKGTMKERHEKPKSFFTLTPVDVKPEEIKLYRDVKKYAETIFNKLKSELSQFYPTHNGVKPRAYIHAWAVKCPVCGKITPLVNNWWLDKRKNISLSYALIDDDLVYSIVENEDVLEGNAKRGEATCLYCASNIENEHIVKEISTYEREVILAVYLDNGKFELPTKEDKKAIEKAKKYLKDSIRELSKFMPIESMPDDKRAIPAKKYLKSWYKLFNPRQLIVLMCLSKEIRKIVEILSKKDNEYATAVGTYLSMILAKHASSNSRGTIWQSTRLAIAHSLTTRGINMMWNHPEGSPFVKSSGSLINNINDVLKGLKFAINELNRHSLTIKERQNIEIYQNSILSWQTDRKFKFIITDPPYYDDVPFPELMQFFQVWHSRTVGDLMGISPIPSTNEELSVSPNRSEEMFENRMLVAIKRLYGLLDDDGVLVMFYVHKKIKGWKYVLEALRKTGFVVTSTISLMTESESNVIAKGKSSIFHSLVITARKRIEDRKVSILEVEEEVRRKMEERYPDLERLYGKDRMNLMVAASGIVIETITKYSEVTSFTKNTADYALEMGQRYLIEVFAKNNLKVDNVDAKTMVYTWLRHSLTDEIDYSEFNQTLKALGTSEETVSDIIYKAKGKGNKVRLLDFSDRGSLEVDRMEPLLAASLIDAVHIALRAYMKGGITAAKEKTEYSTFGSRAILNTIEALARLHSTKTGYREGEICAKFMEDWNALQSKPRKLTDWTERKANSHTRR